MIENIDGAGKKLEKFLKYWETYLQNQDSDKKQLNKV